MLQSILKGLTLGASVAIAPVAAFLLWRSAAWWALPVIAGALGMTLLVGIGQALGWRWARAIAPFVLR